MSGGLRPLFILGEKMSRDRLLSYGTIGEPRKGEGGRHIVALSGGVASAWVGHWARTYIGKGVVYYFNDTKWEHPDLYRFLSDFEGALDVDIIKDNDGRNPEQVFYDNKMLGSDRAPICSKFLKAKKMQDFVLPGDKVYFGIGIHELQRASRIAPIYERLGVEAKFPMIENPVLKHKPFELCQDLGIEIPQMYKDGFEHNNCYGGCVRAGAKQWLSMLRTYPDVFADRERIEREFTDWNNARRLKEDPKYRPRDYHFMKDMGLKELREIEEQGIDFDFGPDEWQGECVGICGRMF